MQRMLLLSAGVLCGVLGLLVCTGCQGPGTVAGSASSKGQEAAGASDDRVAVTVVRPVRKTLMRTTTQPGRIEAFEQTPIYAKIEGYVRKTRTVADKAGKPLVRELADMGDRVEEDEVLAEVSVPEMEEELKQKVAFVGQSKANIEQARAAITRAEGEYRRWKAEHERIDQLADKGAVSRKLVDETENQFRAADASRQEAVARLSVATSQLRVAEADEGHLRALLAYSRIRAPFAGVVTERNVDTGHLVRSAQGGHPLFVVARTDQVRVFTEVPVGDAPLVHADEVAVVRVLDLGDAEFTDKVKRTSWLLDRVSRTLRTEVDLPNDGRLKPGMYVSVRIILAERKDALTLPAAALVRDGKGSYCWCVEDGKAARRPVTLGIRVEDDVEIVSGLSEDASVVRGPPASLKQGQAVTLAAS